MRKDIEKMEKKKGQEKEKYVNNDGEWKWFIFMIPWFWSR
jgi:hypothetical protein